MARIVRVVTTVVMDDGSEFRLAVHDPAPGGDNPAFVGSQLHVAMDMLERRHFDVLEVTYGAQHGRPARPSDELLAPGGVVRMRRGSAPRDPADEEHDVVVGYPGEQIAKAQQVAPPTGSLVRFPDLYGDNVFRTINREAGIYEVYQPRGLPKGDHVQINTDHRDARWEAHND